MTLLWSAPGRWIADQRGGGRAVRVSSHSEGGFVVLSTWQADTCVATVRLLPGEAAELVAGVATELGRIAQPPALDMTTDTSGEAADERIAVLEQRLAAVENGR